jgi:hypothetical protein
VSSSKESLLCGFSPREVTSIAIRLENRFAYCL